MVLKMDVSRWGGWLVLISFALLTTWLVHSLEVEFTTLTEDHHQIPDYTLQNFTSIQLDEQGRLKNKLIAHKMIHYPETNTKLTTPNMVFYKNEQPSWTVHAEQGEVSPDGHQVWLLGRVSMQREGINQQRALEIISRDVWVRLDTEYAETKAPSLILTHNSETHSVGMRVFMPTEQVDLLSQVRGQVILNKYKPFRTTVNPDN